MHPTSVYTFLLVISVIYFVAAGVLALWFPADGLDLYVSYVAGICSRGGASPYEHAELLKAWQTLNTPPALKSTASFPFAYPPSWILICVLLSILPWAAALVLWKFLNVIFLIGAVFLACKLFADDNLDGHDRQMVYVFSFILSPTISVLVTGQTSLFVLFMTLLTLNLRKKINPAFSGIALTLALIKPHLTFPILFFLFLNKHLKTLLWGLSLFLLFTVLGLYISNSSMTSYVEALEIYATSNPATSHIAIGISSILSHSFQINSYTSSILSISCGIASILILHFIHHQNDCSENFLPLLFLIGPIFFRFNSYDIVFLIPFFTWSLSIGKSKNIAFLVQALCFALFIPTEGLRIAYHKGLSTFIPQEVYQLAVATFRSWILVLLLPPAIYILELFRNKR
jgi:hypothetical protein